MIARRESDGGSSSQAQALRSFASYIERVLKGLKNYLKIFKNIFLILTDGRYSSHASTRALDTSR